MSRPIYVTRPYLPPLAEVVPLLERIWEARILTNAGPLHQQLEERLRSLFGIDHVLLMSNGMLALETALEAAGLSGEVITTPYSFVATTHAIRRAGLQPVFVDIRADDLNIDASLIEAAITEQTSAIVAVHCYGNPCAVDEIARIAERHRLRVIYDAAHAFGVTRHGRSLLAFGDFATISFHATKAFNTFEGGAIVVPAPEDATAVENLRNFGIRNEIEIPVVGTNGKMSEFNAALGLVQLDHFARVRGARAAVDRRYRAALAGVAGIEPLALPAGSEPNHSYFPVLVGPDFPIGRDELQLALKQQGIHSRRYFYPLLSSLPMYRDLPSAEPDRLPVATRAAAQILCLPIYPDLGEDDQARVVAALLAARDRA